MGLKVCICGGNFQWRVTAVVDSSGVYVIVVLSINSCTVDSAVQGDWGRGGDLASLLTCIEPKHVAIVYVRYKTEAQWN